MRLTTRIKSKLGGLVSRFENTPAYEKEVLIAGESLLTNKMMMWDSNRLPFSPSNWDEYGFKVFSQNNEDGLIQYIIHHISLPKKTFIEFGVEDYRESNTRFLAWHNNWSGYVMDGSSENIDILKHQEIYWKRNINSKAVFITKDNINNMILESGISGEVGILSVDIDGNDYYILKEIDCVAPQIIICEYNPIFGWKEAVSIPYKQDFFRTDAHYSNLYFGASLGAFFYLLSRRGYKLVCINNLGNNAFFVKRDISDLLEFTPEEAWHDPVFRESRDKDGRMTFKSMEQGRELIANMTVIDVKTEEKKQVRDLMI